MYNMFSGLGHAVVVEVAERRDVAGEVLGGD